MGTIPPHSPKDDGILDAPRSGSIPAEIPPGSTDPGNSPSLPDNDAPCSLDLRNPEPGRPVDKLRAADATEGGPLPRLAVFPSTSADSPRQCDPAVSLPKIPQEPIPGNQVTEKAYTGGIPCGDVSTLERLERPFLDVRFNGRNVRALLDTGSSRTFLGAVGLQPAFREGRPVRVPASGCILTANGNIEYITEEIDLPVEVDGITHEMPIRVVPRLTSDAILGMDFIRAFELVLDGARGTWHLALVGTRHPWYPRDAPTNQENAHLNCCGISELTGPETRELQDFLARETPKVSGKVGCTRLITHQINVGDSPPIK